MIQDHQNKQKNGDHNLFFFILSLRFGIQKCTVIQCISNNIQLYLHILWCSVVQCENQKREISFPTSVSINSESASRVNSRAVCCRNNSHRVQTQSWNYQSANFVVSSCIFRSSQLMKPWEVVSTI